MSLCRAMLVYRIWPTHYTTAHLRDRTSIGLREICSSGLWYLCSELFGNVILSFHTGNILIYSICYQIQTVFNYVLKSAYFTELLCHDCVLLARTLTRMSLLQIKKCRLLLCDTDYWESAEADRRLVY